MTRRDPIDLLARALAEPTLDAMEVPEDLSPPEVALIRKLVVSKANRLADELLAEITPAGWAGVRVARTSFARLQRPALARSQPRGEPEDPHQVSQCHAAPNGPQIAPERPSADLDSGPTP